MDLCAEMLAQHLDGQKFVQPVPFRPTFRRRAQQVPFWGHLGILNNADRLINRFWDYPREARCLAGEFDYYHVCDHSYSQLVHVLPAAHTGVYCHDLIAFRSLLDPQAEPRPSWFRSFMRRVLDGLIRARLVFCSTTLFRERIVATGLFDPDRIILAPYGVAEEFQPNRLEEVILPLSIDENRPFLLHVGTTIPRKRADVVLETFARVRVANPDLRLVQVGGAWTDSHLDQIDRLGIGADVIQLRGLERSTLAALYQRAGVVLLPSEAEGFGLPLIEALACGAIVVASDLDVFREVGGPTPIYAPIGDVEAWTATVTDLLHGQGLPISREARLAWASRYTWDSHAKTIAKAYLNLA